MQVADKLLRRGVLAAAIALAGCVAFIVIERTTSPVISCASPPIFALRLATHSCISPPPVKLRDES